MLAEEPETSADLDKIKQLQQENELLNKKLNGEEEDDEDIQSQLTHRQKDLLVRVWGEMQNLYN